MTLNARVTTRTKAHLFDINVVVVIIIVIVVVVVAAPGKVFVRRNQIRGCLMVI